MTREFLKIPERWGKEFSAYFNYEAFYADPISHEACSRLERLPQDNFIHEFARTQFKKTKTDNPWAVADFLMAAAHLPDSWDEIQREARGLPKRYKQTLSASCNQI